jgi:hypothetical protein
MALRSLVLLTLLLGACAEEASPGGVTGEPSGNATLELRSSEEAPEGAFTWDGETYDAELGTHCWTTMCVDFAGPPVPKAYAPIPGDLEIELAGDGNAESVTVGRPSDEEFGPLEDEREVEMRSGRLTLDLDPGRYVLVVFATWDQGDGVLAVGLDVS